VQVFINLLKKLSFGELPGRGLPWASEAIHFHQPLVTVLGYLLAVSGII
jgi:hypothetical protein